MRGPYGRSMKKTHILLAATAALAGCGSSASGPGFSSTVDNQWFPLPPGTVWTYTGVKDGKRSRDVVRVTSSTKSIQGAPTRAVSDLLYTRGRLAERTTDWYSQDKAGNVWYFGEVTAELDGDGKVASTEGTWQAGVHGARPGILFPAHPHVGQTATQEYYKGHAEDHFQVLSVGRTVLTKEWTPLEPGVIDHKLYARGKGTIREETVKGGNERNVLVSMVSAPARP